MSSEAISLYRGLMRHATRVAGYNFRQYAIRRIRDGFISNRAVSDPEQVAELLKDGRKQLSLVSRQATISQMYAVPNLVVERQA